MHTLSQTADFLTPQRGVPYRPSGTSLRHISIQTVITILVACAGVLFSIGAAAQTAGKFVPTETEWAVWPKYCQARYVDIPLGKSTEFARLLTREQINRIRVTLSPETFHSIHHYCFAIGYMKRAKDAMSAVDSRQHKFYLNKVVNECQYTLERMNLEDSVAVDVSYLMGTALSMIGENAEGVSLVERVIEAQRDRPAGYVALALLYRGNNEATKALETIELAFDRVAVPSADLHFTAGIAYFDANNLEFAQRHAIEAYRLGYPLPGLKRKLAARGYWPPKNTRTDE